MLTALPRPVSKILRRLAALALLAPAALPAQNTSAPIAVGTAAPERFFTLFHPYRTDSAAISPDGKLLAYSIREDDDLFVVTVEIDNPAKVRAKVKVGTAASSTPKLQGDLVEKVPPRIRWMGWATDNRLVIETNANHATLTTDKGWINTSGAIFAVNADGTNGRDIVTPRDVEKTKLDPFRPSSNVALPRSNNGGNIPALDAMPFSGGRTSLTGFEEVGPNESLFLNRVNSLPLDVRTPRTPTVFDYAPGKPDWLTIRTTDPRDYALFSVNINNGDLKFGPNERTEAEITPLLNRQGRYQIAIANTLRTPFPHPYLVQKTAAISLGRWNELNEIAKIPGVDFSLSPLLSKTARRKADFGGRHLGAEAVMENEVGSHAGARMLSKTSWESGGPDGGVSSGWLSQDHRSL